MTQEIQKLTALASHVLAMGNDAYLDGHPEWREIVKEAALASYEVDTDMDGETLIVKINNRHYLFDDGNLVWDDDGGVDPSIPADVLKAVADHIKSALR